MAFYFRYKPLLTCRNFYKSQSQLQKFTCLGIETSCDDTGVAVVDSDGNVLGESVYSQLRDTVRFGGVIPPIAAAFHRQSLRPAFADAISQASKSSTVSLDLDGVDFIAVTYGPGLPIALRTGLEFAKELAIRHKKPLLPVHHMQAHALIPRLTEDVEYPFLVLLISGGHSLLVFVKSPEDFMLLGSSLDDAPGEVMDKTARLLKLQHVPEYQAVSGGRAVEMMASQSSNGPLSFDFPHVMTAERNCDFSFAGLKFHARKLILRQERDKGVLGGSIVPSASDICSSLQLAILRHLSTRLARAIVYCDMNELWQEHDKKVVVSGGVACNQFLRSGLAHACSTLGCQTIFPPVKYCTDNGVMIAWNAVERITWRRKLLNECLNHNSALQTSMESISNVQPIGKLLIGTDLRQAVTKCHLRAPRIKFSM